MSSKDDTSFLGPTYSYAKNIRTPEELEMSDEGTLDALGKDIAGIINYTELLITGTTKASKNNGQPLGNRFFLQTKGLCTPVDKPESKAERYMYISNIPDGNIPILSSLSGKNASMLRGLVPGVMGNLTAFNPLEIMDAFTQDTKPKCTKVKLPIVDTNNRVTWAEKYVANYDLENINGCSFPDDVQNASSTNKRVWNTLLRKGQKGCGKQYKGEYKAGFRVLNQVMNEELPNADTKITPFANMYNLGFSALFIYILYNFFKKN